MFSTNNAFAATISFDTNTYFSDHSFIISITDNSVPTGATPQVRVTDNSGGNACDYPLLLVDPVNHIYQTPPVGFSTTATCTNVVYKLLSTTNSITASYPAGSASPVTTTASVIDANSLGTVPSAPTSIASSFNQIMWSNQVSDCSQYGNDSDHD